MATKSELSPKLMNRQQRLKIAKSWSQNVNPKKKIKAYKDHFGVDKYCAAFELKKAGVEMSEKFAERWATHFERKRAHRKQLQQKKRLDPIQASSSEFGGDGEFYFIAGHTSAGFPYGITWDQALEDQMITREEYNSREVI